MLLELPSFDGDVACSPAPALSQPQAESSLEESEVVIPTEVYDEVQALVPASMLSAAGAAADVLSRKPTRKQRRRAAGRLAAEPAVGTADSFDDDLIDEIRKLLPGRPSVVLLRALLSEAFPAGQSSIVDATLAAVSVAWLWRRDMLIGIAREELRSQGAFENLELQALCLGLSRAVDG